MQIDIASHIEKLLFLHDSLTIPGFGAFTARPTTALADYAGGTVTPPSKTLTFNENITTDDGLLIQDVAKTHALSYEQSRETVETYVANMQRLLDHREIVTLSGIGRLYKNYVQKIQFLPDAANFNAESFGLPPLQFTPITRSREVAESPAIAPHTGTNNPASAATTPASAPVYTPAPQSSSGSGVVPMLVTILLLLCAMAGYWMWKQSRSSKKTASEELPKTEQQAEKPAKAKQAPPPATPSASTAAGDPEDLNQDANAAVAEKMKAAREEIKSGTGKRECILVVATLQEEANADRLVGMLEKEGYQVYFLRKNGFQVGIQFRYNSLNEVQERIVALQNLTGEQNIWIKKK